MQLVILHKCLSILMPNFLKLNMYQIVWYLSIRLLLLLNTSFGGLCA